MFQNLSTLLSQNQAPNTAGTLVNQAGQANALQQQNISGAQQQIGQAKQFDKSALNKNIQNMNESALSSDLNAKYKGPAAGSVNAAPKNIQQIQQQGANLGTTGGQMALLNQQYGGGKNYSSGEQRYDAGLQARNTGFQKQAAQAQNLSRRLSNQAGAANSALNTQAANTAVNTQRFANDTRQGLGGFEEETQKGAQQAASEANKKDAEAYQAFQALRDKIQGGKLTDDQLSALGLQAGQRTYGANLGDAVDFSGGQGNTTADEILSKEDLGKFQMVQKLLGDKNQVFDPTKAGTYKAGASALNKEKAAKAIEQQKANYDQALAPALNDYKGAQQLVSELTQAANMRDPNQQNATWQSIVARYGLNPSGGIGRNLEWATKDNLVRHQNRFNQVQKQLDSAYGGTVDKEG